MLTGSRVTRKRVLRLLHSVSQHLGYSFFIADKHLKELLEMESDIHIFRAQCHVLEATDP